MHKRDNPAVPTCDCIIMCSWVLVLSSSPETRVDFRLEWDATLLLRGKMGGREGGLGHQRKGVSEREG